MGGMTTQEETTYKLTVHLIDGTVLEAHAPITATELMEVYGILGRDDGGRVKFPTAAAIHE